MCLGAQIAAGHGLGQLVHHLHGACLGCKHLLQAHLALAHRADIHRTVGDGLGLTLVIANQAAVDGDGQLGAIGPFQLHLEVTHEALGDGLVHQLVANLLANVGRIAGFHRHAQQLLAIAACELLYGAIAGDAHPIELDERQGDWERFPICPIDGQLLQCECDLFR